jgi:hypothetical protein
LLGVLGEALYRHGVPRYSSSAPRGRLRTAVPLTTRRVRRGDSTGNDTAAAMLDLPVGPMDPAARIVDVAGALARHGEDGHSEASRFAVRVLGLLPSGLHARAARLVYGGRFFSLIASVMPGWRREVLLLGAPISSVFPVLPLAEGVGLAVGFLSWGENIGVGVTADSVLYPDADGFAARIEESFERVAMESAAGPGEVAGHVR